MTAATKIEETEGGHQINSFQKRHNLEERELNVKPLPLESRPQKLPPPSPCFLLEQSPSLPATHRSLLDEQKKINRLWL
ncbi:hypothetical protein V6N11_053482 [Hibiscus sabdariffa]|uniref:Uncharacterized protein n=1 Tax=Hibiscus sabdariffa TaxID=183260 RepID=A0ABR2UD46_9ROSI